jgi:uncharacterized membrane protein
LAGALAYFFIPAIIFLLVEPYRRNRFVRFHSFQCLGLCLAGVVIAAVLRIASVLLFYIPVLGQLLVVLACLIVALAWCVTWGVLVVKALQREMFELPLVGEFAQRKASAA